MNRSLYLTVGGGVVAFAFAMTIYVLTLAPTVLYYDRPILLDSAMLQVQAITLGIPGGTGSPSWVMLTHLFTYLPIGDPAYRANFASAVYASGAVTMVYVIGYLLTRRVFASLAGAVAFAVGTTLWSQAVITEVYPLNALLSLLPVAMLLVWRDNRRDRYLLAACFLMGFALTNHITSGLVLPVSFLFVGLVDRRKFLEWRLVLKGAGLFVVGLTPYIYLPIRSAMNPPLDEWRPTNFERFWYLVSGGDHHVNSFAFGPSAVPGRFMLYLDYLTQNFHWAFVMVALVGVLTLALRDRAGAVLLFALWAGWTFHAIEYNIYDYNLYFITTFTMVCVSAACGFSGLLEIVEDIAARAGQTVLRQVAVGVFVVAFVLLSGVRLQEAYAANDMSDAYEGKRINDSVARNAPQGAMILHHRSSLWYMTIVEGRRTDLKLADPWPPGRHRYKDIVWPDDIDYVTTNLRYGTNDETGVSTAGIYARTGPVYILDQESAAPYNFRDAGFGIYEIDRGILYELVPPGGKPYGPRDPSDDDIASGD